MARKKAKLTASNSENPREKQRVPSTVKVMATMREKLTA
jgi:hypothetical protein